MPRGKTNKTTAPAAEKPLQPQLLKSMDLGTPIRNPAAGHSSFIDEKALEWGGVNADILYYLQSVDTLQSFADLSQNAEDLADRSDAFLENAKVLLSSLGKIAESQKTWTELRKEYGSTVANAISSIRNLNASFGVEMEKLDARDRATMTKLKQKRDNALVEIATDLNRSLEAENQRHLLQLQNAEDRQKVTEERKQITSTFQEKRKALMDRVRNGSRALNPSSEPLADIPVSVHTPQAHQSTSNATGTPGGWGQRFQNFWGQFVS